MDWKNADPIIEIDAQIAVLERAQRDAQTELAITEHLAQDAAAVQHRAEDAAHDARTNADRIRRAVRDFAAEINQLRQERQQIAPRQSTLAAMILGWQATEWTESDYLA